MKSWAIALGILVILTAFYSPVLAMSKSDLISQYRTESLSDPSSTVTRSTVSSVIDIPAWTARWEIRIPGGESVPSSRVLTDGEANKMGLTFIQAVYPDPSGISYNVGFDETGKTYFVPQKYAQIFA
jgi:hypothetical protein